MERAFIKNDHRRSLTRYPHPRPLPIFFARRFLFVPLPTNQSPWAYKKIPSDYKAPFVGVVLYLIYHSKFRRLFVVHLMTETQIKFYSRTFLARFIILCLEKCNMYSIVKCV